MARGVEWKEHYTPRAFSDSIAAVSCWGPSLRNKRVLFLTDNMALVHIINKQTTKESKVMSLVRHLVLACMSHNIYFKAKHLPGKLNSLVLRTQNTEL